MSGMYADYHRNRDPQGRLCTYFRWPVITAERPDIKRAINFLVATQKPDGSWPMTSRPTPDGKPGSAKLLTPIMLPTVWPHGSFTLAYVVASGPDRPNPRQSEKGPPCGDIGETPAKGGAAVHSPDIADDLAGTASG